jgi:hypothetical protein
VREMHAACPLVAPQGTPRFHRRLILLADDRNRKGGDWLTIALSVVLILSLVVLMLCRYTSLRLWHVITCIMLGFYLASSSLAPDIRKFVASLLRAF